MHPPSAQARPEPSPPTGDKEAQRAGFEVRFRRVRGVKALASLPSREALLAQLMATMNAAIGKFVRTLNEVPARFVRTLAAVRDAKEKAAA